MSMRLRGAVVCAAAPRRRLVGSSAAGRPLGRQSYRALAIPAAAWSSRTSYTRPARTTSSVWRRSADAVRRLSVHNDEVGYLARRNTAVVDWTTPTRAPSPELERLMDCARLRWISPLVPQDSAVGIHDVTSKHSSFIPAIPMVVADHGRVRDCDHVHVTSMARMIEQHEVERVDGCFQ